MKKAKTLKRGVALLTALALTTGLTLTPALAYGAGTELHKSVTTISDDLKFVNTVSTHSSGRQESYSMEYTPTQEVSPVVWSGSTVLGKTNILEGADALTAQGYYVLGGINADFFSLSTGIPMGLVIQDGRIVSSDDGRPAVAFREDGSAFLTTAELQFVLTNQGGGDPTTGLGVAKAEEGADTPTETPAETPTEEPKEELPEEETPPAGENPSAGTEVPPPPEEESGAEERSAEQPASRGAAGPASHAGEVVVAHHYNKMRQNYYLYLLSSEFGKTNGATELGRNVLFRVMEGEVSVSGTVSLVVTAVNETSQATAIPEGCLLLTANAKSPYYDELTKFCVGDQVTLSVTTSDNRLSEAVCAVGGGDVLIRNGSITEPSGWDSGVAFSRHPRTALGIKADGTVVIYAVDGRRSSYSNGLTEWDLAEELYSQGCVEAINLDGGGSTTFLFREPEDDSYTVVNSPSDGSLRKCSTFLYFVMNEKGDGVAKNLYFANRDRYVMAGSALDYSELTARDSGYRKTALPSDVVVDLDRDSYQLGYVEDGVFYVGSAAGTAVVTAEGGDAFGSTTATVVTEVDSLAVVRSDTGETVSALHLDPHESIQLKGKGTVNGFEALSSPSAFTFTADGGAGSIDGNGLFTAGEILGSTGTIHVSFGSRTVTIPVQIGEEETLLLENFEGDDTIFNGGDPSLMYVTNGSDWVAKGSRAGVLVYDFGLSTAVDYRLPTPIALNNAVSQAALWVRGDNSGAVLSLLVMDADGTEREVPFNSPLNYSGYTQLTAAVASAGRGQITGFRLTDAAQTLGKGVICIDQLVLPGEAGMDTQPPKAVLTCGDGVVTAVLSDNGKAAFTPAMISLSLDGAEIPFTMDGNVVTARYTLETEGIHRVSLTVSDPFGNQTRVSQNLMGETLKNPFYDVQKDFWAHPYITFLYDQGIVNGVDAGHFDPNGAMTRAAFCTMLSRYLKLDASAYENVSLPFADLDAIPQWALPHVKALYSLGYVGGRNQGDGTTVFAPEASITRAEIFTLLGRLAPKGYENGYTAQFADEASIAEWAMSGVKTVVAMGVVDGYEDNTIRTANTATRAEVAKILFFYY